MLRTCQKKFIRGKKFSENRNLLFCLIVKILVNRKLKLEVEVGIKL